MRPFDGQCRCVCVSVSYIVSSFRRPFVCLSYVCFLQIFCHVERVQTWHSHFWWKFSELPKISWNYHLVEIFGSSKNFSNSNFPILTSYGNFRKFRKFLIAGCLQSRNFRKFRKFLSSIFAYALFLSMLIIFFHGDWCSGNNWKLLWFLWSIFYAQRC